ncbi:RcnB family protein [Lonsdalea quercina]|uniref:RcnB family protein n=1 Tax=Lonsdalea quercina TaxID=71657 RepID=UPI003976C4A7
MKKITMAMVMTVFTASSLLSTVSFAAGPDHQDGKQWQQGPGSQQHGSHDGNRGGQANRGGHGEPGRQQAHVQRGGDRDHFVSNGHDFRRGKPAPTRYRGNDYRVNDWRARGLRQPPSGQHWAYIDGNYVLIAAATGVITSIILNSALQH